MTLVASPVCVNQKLLFSSTDSCGLLDLNIVWYRGIFCKTLNIRGIKICGLMKMAYWRRFNLEFIYTMAPQINIT